MYSIFSALPELQRLLLKNRYHYIPRRSIPFLKSMSDRAINRPRDGKRTSNKGALESSRGKEKIEADSRTIAKRAASRRIVVRPGNSLERLHRDYEITRRRSRPLSESARNRKSPARFAASRRRFAASDYDPVIALTISLGSEAPHFPSPRELLARAITEGRVCTHART